MALANVIMACAALIGGMLCARAFLPHVHIFGPRPVDNLARGILIGTLESFPRIFYWDVIWTLHLFRLPTGVSTNLIFNAALLIGIFYVLRARWLTIPEAERGRYNILTAAFYPDALWPRLRRDDQRGE